MKITAEQLKEMNACADGIEWFKTTFPNGVGLKRGTEVALESGQFSFANWFIVKRLSDKNRIRYAIYAANLVLHIFEEKYPNDDRPRKAIEAAEEYLMNGNTSADAAAAADAAFYAAYATCADNTIKAKILNYGVSLIIKQGVLKNELN